MFRLLQNFIAWLSGTRRQEVRPLGERALVVVRRRPEGGDERNHSAEGAGGDRSHAPDDAGPGHAAGPSGMWAMGQMGAGTEEPTGPPHIPPDQWFLTLFQGGVLPPHQINISSVEGRVVAMDAMRFSVDENGVPLVVAHSHRARLADGTIGSPDADVSMCRCGHVVSTANRLECQHPRCDNRAACANCAVVRDGRIIHREHFLWERFCRWLSHP